MIPAICDGSRIGGCGVGVDEDAGTDAVDDGGRVDVTVFESGGMVCVLGTSEGLVMLNGKVDIVSTCHTPSVTRGVEKN